jgi:Protein of unknown function (DUF2846)
MVKRACTFTEIQRSVAHFRKSMYVDDQLPGESAPMIYLYKAVTPGEHTISTESEFSNNDLIVRTGPGMNYSVRQYIKFGVFAGGANLELVPEEDGNKGVMADKLARQVCRTRPVARFGRG